MVRLASVAAVSASREQRACAAGGRTPEACVAKPPGRPNSFEEVAGSARGLLRALHVGAVGWSACARACSNASECACAASLRAATLVHSISPPSLDERLPRSSAEKSHHTRLTAWLRRHSQLCGAVTEHRVPGGTLPADYPLIFNHGRVAGTAPMWGLGGAMAQRARSRRAARAPCWAHALCGRPSAALALRSVS